ncbi:MULTISPECIES: HupE/UreJ family protein [Cyanophyceae]|nr:MULTISPECIES: HupE/UreJ family protein [Cyanophyceae]ACB00867.1 HupE / UreJ family protein [Picosynechococcus sp. PCC 7002]SMH58935.1 urease accessory protein [Picosynechococcus sp. OG1]SMQ86542.1 urease accessory protein [Synechococcus sp. 7002]
MKSTPHFSRTRMLVMGGFMSLSSVALAAPALAHHPFGGSTPTNAIQGFLSGLGHPVIGLDHLAFVVVIGLLAAAMGQGLIMPITFTLMALVGTGMHLMGLNLPLPEVIISASVLLFGILLALKQPPAPFIVLALAAISGLFHGYAYGEAIVGADMGPLFSYLLGFTSIQMVITITAYTTAKRLAAKSEVGTLNLRFAGSAFAGLGFAFLSGIWLA